MKVQVLASVMNQSMEAIVTKMNLSSDAIIINQCDSYDYSEMEHKGRQVRFFSCDERGVGRSRNNGILRADRDICLFSDEDIVYKDDYEAMIIEEFRNNPKADMILFNIEIEESRQTYHIKERSKVSWYNCGRYGAVSFAVRTDKLLKSGVMFSLLFGGGAQYSNGEDSLFLKEFMDKGYKVYTAPVTIGREIAQESTWFTGYDKKFFFDRGVLYYYLYGKLAPLLTLRFLLAHKKKMCKEITINKAYEYMSEGRKSAKT